MTEKYIGVGQWSTRKKVYHTDPECLASPENTKPVTEREIAYHEMRECKYCAGEHGGYDTSGDGHFKSLLDAAKNHE